MDEYYEARNRMVEEQLLNRGIKNLQVLEAMRKVERHLFVDKKYVQEAYNDSPVSIDCSQTISQPYIVALMTELLSPNKDKKVLEIGTGSGYQTAILAELCKKVYSVERHTLLAKKADDLIKSLGYKNVTIKVTDGTLGWQEKSPFDAIIVTASAPDIPEALIQQLKNRGNMVIPIGSHYQQSLKLISKRGDSYISKTICSCVFVPLIGREGWKE